MSSLGELVADLHRLGIAEGEVVMVHASMRAIRPVDNGAEGVVEALERAVGPDGTLLMNLGARDDWDWVNAEPEAERERLLADAPPFDALQTVADPDVGVLAEVLRTLPGTLVNDHPDGRFGARGRLAQQLLADLPWNDYYGPGSVLERLVTLGGKVLRLGADPDTVTLMHYAEYLVPLESKRRVRRHHRVLGPDGPTVRAVDSLDDSVGIVDYPGEDYFAVILGAYLSTGRGSIGKVGSATSELLDAADLVAFSVEWMAEHFH